MSNKLRLLEELNRCVVEMEDEEVIDVAKEYVESGYDAYEGITEGLAKGMERAGDLFEEEEYFVPELLICSDAMYNGLEEMKPYIKKDTSDEKCNIIIGVVEGDTHDIGKNLVKIMMETAGFKVYDLGRDVPVETFLKKVKEVETGIVCMSTLMTTTMANMDRVIEELSREGLRDKVKVMVGGGPLSQSYAEKIGADAYTSNAAEAAKKAKELALELKNL